SVIEERNGEIVRAQRPGRFPVDHRVELTGAQRRGEHASDLEEDLVSLFYARPVSPVVVLGHSGRAALRSGLEGKRNYRRCAGAHTTVSASVPRGCRARPLTA